MSNLSLVTKDGGTTSIAPAAIERLRAHLQGSLCLSGDPGYDEGRTLWNAMIDRKPGVLVRAARAEDVVAAVNFAREEGLLLSIKGAGHNIAGNAACEGGLMIDLSLMRNVNVDPKARTAVVQPGATLADLDGATQAHGLATPVGINSTTGVAGLALGGGYGWLSRKYGLTADNLISAEVVTANGEKVRASATENEDLFWAIRGGSGNFGVVTSFEFRLHPVGPEVLQGLVVYPFDQAKQVLDAYRKFAPQSPEELTAWVVLRQAPPLPFLPESVHGKEVVVIAFCHIGDAAKAEKDAAPLQTFGTPVGAHVGRGPFADWQKGFDPLLTPGARNYWKSHNFNELPDGLIAVLLDAIKRLPGPECEIFIALLGGAINRVPVSATAYPHRDALYTMNAHGRWREAKDDAGHMGWARDLFKATTPYATGGVYVNFMPADEADRVKSGAYGPNFDRLARLKARFDPQNLFRMNQNIRVPEQAGTPGA
jgi:FAD/FMN-containing dehydrogenase